jgi:IclR family transcriptional regulator, pca regulon regulatory protein
MPVLPLCGTTAMPRSAQVRKQGYAVSDGENAYGLRTLAAPVLGQDRSVIAGVSLTIDAGRMDIKTFEKSALPEIKRIAALLTNAAQMSG